ncbi:hypothetical protein [Ruminococcus flavefaciens]|nr:hypothetical protein [Ruminococcus flavefaciens]
MMEPKFETTEIAGCIGCQALVATTISMAYYPCGATIVGVIA